MTNLAGQKCEACRVGAPPATEEQITSFMPTLPEWQIMEVDGIKRLIRSYPFADFRAALVFTNKVGVIAEEEGHHPALLTEWGKVTVSWWTHKIRGLHINDFIMAAKTDTLI